MEKIKEVLKDMKENMPGFLAGAIVEGQEGLTVVEEKNVDDIDIQISAAYGVETARFQERAITSLGKDSLQNIITISRNYILLIKPVGDTGFFIHIIVSREKAALGILIAMLLKYETLLSEAIKEWA